MYIYIYYYMKKTGLDAFRKILTSQRRISTRSIYQNTLGTLFGQIGQHMGTYVHTHVNFIKLLFSTHFYLPARSTRLMTDDLVILFPASLFDFCLKLIATIVWARLQENYAFFHHGWLSQPIFLFSFRNFIIIQSNHIVEHRQTLLRGGSVYLEVAFMLVEIFRTSWMRSLTIKSFSSSLTNTRTCFKCLVKVKL